MQRGRFLLLIITSVIVLGGIIAVQAFWIINSSKVQKERFDQATMRSLQSVVSTIEQQKEAVAQVTHKLTNPRHGVYGVSILTDTSQHVKRFDYNDPFFQDNWVINASETRKNPEQLQIELSQPEVNDSSILLIRKTQKRVLQSGGIAGNANDEDTAYKEKLKKRSILINDIVNELAFISINRNLNEKVNFYTLDSIVKAELRQNGIHTPVITDIVDSKNNSLTINNASGLRDEIYNSSYRIGLFPNEYLMESDYLVLFFPDRSSFIMHSMWEIVTLSILIILILAGLIFISLSTIFKQKRLSLMKNDFINNMTHELKTPISTISLACEALRDKSVTLPQNRQDSFVKMIDDENKRLSVLVDNVLKSAVWDSAEFKLKKTVFSLSKVVNEVTKSFKIQVERKNGEIMADYKQNEDQILADKVHISNVIFNLLDNANKYTAGNPYIKISLKNIEDKIELEIKDNGIGISLEDQKRIFEKFYREHTGDIHNVKGHGLGLAYARRILDDHHGTISVESERGKGSIFIIKLPLIN